MKRGRKLMLEENPGLIDDICKFIQMGCSVKDACEAAGISQTAYYEWLERAKGPNPSPIFTEFADRTSRARAESKATLVGVLKSCAIGEPIFNDAGEVVGRKNKDWRAAAHMLACRYPDEWSERRRHEHSGPAGKPIEVQTYEAISLPATAEEPEDDA